MLASKPSIVASGPLLAKFFPVDQTASYATAWYLCLFATKYVLLRLKTEWRCFLA